MIPQDIEECFTVLEQTLAREDLDFIKNNKTEDHLVKLHHFLGRFIRNEWGLWTGSELSRYFNTLGLFHPDDMSGVIITSFYRHLHKLPLQIESQVQRYKDFWEMQKLTQA